MASAGASSISVTVRVRPFTIREAAQLTKTDDSTLFLGDGSLAAAPTPRISSKGGIRPVIKVLDERCLYAACNFNNRAQRELTCIQHLRPARGQPSAQDWTLLCPPRQACEGPDIRFRPSLRRHHLTGRHLRVNRKASTRQCLGRLQRNSLCLWRYGMRKDTYHHVRGDMHTW